VNCTVSERGDFPALATGWPASASGTRWGYCGDPAELVRGDTVDLEVPASAETVEWFIRDDKATDWIEGLFGELTS
jgi:hypothetical protein